MDDEIEENKNRPLPHHPENNTKILVYIINCMCVCNMPLVCDYLAKEQRERAADSHLISLPTTSQLALRLDRAGNIHKHPLLLSPSVMRMPVSLGIFGKKKYYSEFFCRTLLPTEDCFPNDRNRFALSGTDWTEFLHFIREQVFMCSRSFSNKGKYFQLTKCEKQVYKIEANLT